MDQIETAARMAGKWWAERLDNKYADRRQAFANAVEMRVLQELRGECHWDWFGTRIDGRGYEDRCEIEFDYDPHNCLYEALYEAIPSMSAMDRKECLPRKHLLRVYADRLSPKEGYGNWTSDVPVPAVGAA